MIAALAILKRLAPYLIAIAVFAGWTYASYHFGSSTATTARNAYYDKIIADRDAADAKNRQQATDQARADELARQQLMADIDTKHQQEMNDAKLKTDQIISDLRNGTLRLRNALDVAASAIQRLPGTPAAPGVSDGSQASGLSGGNAEFLLRKGGDADDIVRELDECQAVVIADRVKLGQPAPALVEP